MANSRFSLFQVFSYSIIICLTLFYLRKPTLAIAAGIMMTGTYSKFRDVPMFGTLAIIVPKLLLSATLFYLPTIEQSLSFSGKNVDTLMRLRSSGSGLYAKLYAVPLFPFGWALRSLAGLFRSNTYSVT